MFDKDTLYNYIWMVLSRELPDARYSEVKRITEELCEAVSEWVPKQGDFWLDEDSGMLFVNKGWEVVCAEALE